ncbi:stress responsive A/B barrel domain-containing protein [Histoplasma capsulatum G186AR]|uniref:Stress responsive A/B barrel domain-containing protein n=2 Tax=Ajellomyces capsulatus TaxID=5037 RepID=C0NJF6_AJECG|nr:stress responsive A/B barrel domain-containing protein [Histoplasma capsulatum G186AR]EEH07997.1 stress responsive A/B barrel domain-containing protein [Histoplasma capsulatum G186AR]KAG5299681.1 stress responsive A/B barrel domain-containing protein [Histoplasma capsulatum]QSS67693.1 stress responsive A/B barrel domain-containing protein [Histoplasma capsulatum G186AR]
MGITHIVCFQFKADATPEAIDETCSKMLGLKDACIHPTHQKPYIKSAMGGKDISKEGLQNGFTHAFVTEFENAEDRDYYTQKDPAHLAFVSSLSAMIEKVHVMDFVDGAF